MSRGALLTGTAGGIIGTLPSGIGIVWSITNIQLYLEMQSRINLYNLLSLMDMLATFYDFYGGSSFIYFLFILQPMSYPPTPFLLLSFIFSLIVSILLIVSGILTGVGFYGVYKGYC